MTVRVCSPRTECFCVCGSLRARQKFGGMSDDPADRIRRTSDALLEATSFISRSLTGRLYFAIQSGRRSSARSRFNGGAAVE